MTGGHVPVLLDETVDALVTDPEGVYVDGTYGRGGHSRRLLSRLGAAATLWVLDRDPEAIRDAHELAAMDSRIRVAQARFSELDRVVADVGSVAGVLLDVGVSSPQLDSPARGFSFLRAGPLDMRMDPTKGVTAGEWLNTVPEEELSDAFREYGGERHHRRVARAIVEARPIETTERLAEVVSRATRSGGSRSRGGRSGEKKHAATRVFQAVRIVVNQELDELDAALDAAFRVLCRGGRLAVITFHSLEHALVRNRFKFWVQGRDDLPRRLPVVSEWRPLARRVVRGQTPKEPEIAANPRSRSARLQVIEKVAEVST